MINQENSAVSATTAATTATTATMATMATTATTATIATTATAANTAIAAEPFRLPEMAEGDFTAEELAEDMDGMQMRLKRVKIPGGGTLQFEMATDDPDNPDYVKYLEGVILYNHAAGAYWPEGNDYDDSIVPLCSSPDGKQGIGEPGGTCVVCQLNRYGTGKEGKGKACKNMRFLYLLQSGEYMPLQLTLPPTSLRPFQDFLNMSFTLRRRATYGSVVQIGLRKMNNGKDDYSVATFRRRYDFGGEELAQIRAYAEGFKEQIKTNIKQQMEAFHGQRDDGCDYTDMTADIDDVNTDIRTRQLPLGTGDSFTLGTIIDGEREALPA